MADQDRSPPKLKLVATTAEPIDGKPLIDFPATLVARSPIDRSTCRVRVSREDVTKAVLAGRRQPAVEFWSILARKLPPVPFRDTTTLDGLSGLSDAQACFLGVKRPHGADDDGATTAAYILKPTHYCEYDGRPPVFSAAKLAVPPGLVFVAYVVLDAPHETSPTVGVLTHWSFVRADSADARLPHDHATRYGNAAGREQ